MQQVAGSFEA